MRSSSYIRLPPRRLINALVACFDAMEEHWAHGAAKSTRLISIAANSKQLNFRSGEGKWREEIAEDEEEGKKKRIKNTIVLLRSAMCRRIVLAVAERGYNHHNDNYVGKCGYRRTNEGRGGRERERRRWDPIPPPTRCLIRSFANYRRKHRVNCYTRARLSFRSSGCSIESAFSSLCLPSLPSSPLVFPFVLATLPRI